MRAWAVLAFSVVLLMFAAGPASAVSFVFTGAAPSWSVGTTAPLNIDCSSPFSNSSTSADFSCAQNALTLSPSQVLNIGQSYYYYLGSLTTNEEDTGGYIRIAHGEYGSATMTVTFDTDVTSAFSLGSSVTIYTWSGGDSPDGCTNAFGCITINSSSQARGITAEPGNYLLATLLFSSTQQSNGVSSGHLDSPYPTFVSSYEWTANGATEYLYLQMEYESPEPATFVLIGSALLGLGLLHRRKRSTSTKLISYGIVSRNIPV